MQELAQVKSEAFLVSTVASYKDYEPIYKINEPYGIIFIIIGVVLVPVSLVIIWKNERRAVNLASLTYYAKVACVQGDPKTPR